MGSITRPELILFDLDGTLVNTAPDLIDALNTTMKDLDFQTYQGDQIEKWVGNGAKTLLRFALQKAMGKDPNPTDLDRITECFLENYGRNVCVKSHCYLDVIDVLNQLSTRNIKMGCVTNKQARFSEPILQKLGLLEYFNIILFGDSLVKKKPNPLPLLHAAKQLKIDPKKSWMVGDSKNDILAARAANFHIICVDYGYNQRIDILKERPDVVISHFKELIDLL